MSAVLTLQPDAVLRLRWNRVPTADELKLVRAIPGARAVQGGYEWGWWPETANRIVSLWPPGEVVGSGLLAGVHPFNGADNGFGPDGWTWVREERAEAVEWRSPTAPRPHQLAFKIWRRGGGRDGLYHPACLLEAGLGLGKTLSAIEEMLELLLHRPRARILVLARSSLIETVWAAQLEQHAAGLPYTLLNCPRSERLRLLGRQLHGPMVYLHSHEDLPGAVKDNGKPSTMGKALAALEWDMIVVDETSRFRTAGAQRTGRLTGYQARPLTAPFRLGLSGLPMIKQATDLYPVLRWLGAPTGNKGQFMERFMRQNPYTSELSLGDADGLRSLLDCWRFQVPKSAVLRIPRAWHYEKIELKPWQRALYRKLQKELNEYDPEALVSSHLEQLLRLAQLTAGFEGDRYRVDNAKLEHLTTKILPEIGEDQAIIWVRFQQEALGVAQGIRASDRSAVAFTGAQKPAENEMAYNLFAGGHDQFFVSTLAKGAHGLNLPMASAMVYQTRDFDTELVLQSLERNARLTTTHQALNVFVPEARDSIDEKMSQVLGDDVRAASQLTALDVREVLG